MHLFKGSRAAHTSPDTVERMGTETGTRTLRYAAVEHAMRACQDAALVIPFLHCEPHSPEALTALGRLVSVARVPLSASSPLVLFCSGTLSEHTENASPKIEENWREKVFPVEQSLWGELSVLRSVYSPVSQAWTDPLEELLALRNMADADFQPDA